jgi:N-methylhydantoinase A
MLVSDVRHDFVRTFPVAVQDGFPLDGVNERFREMVGEAIEVLEREDVPRSLMQFRRSLDMRYVGQEYTINVTLPDEFLDERNVHDVQETFHLLHQRTYGHSSSREPTEIVNLHVVAIGQVEKPDLGALERGGLEPEAAAAIDEAHMYSPGDRVWIRTPVYKRDGLLAGNRIQGPALVVEKGATTVVELGFELEVKPQGHLRLSRQH